MDRGRPSIYTAELAEEVCRGLADGLSLRQVCKPAHMPVESTVRLWAVRDWEGFNAQYRAARDAQIDKFRDEIVEIADDCTNDWIERERKDGSVETIPDREHITRSTLRVHTRQWIMERQTPKEWGQKGALQLSGANGGPVVYKWAAEDAE